MRPVAPARAARSRPAGRSLSVRLAANRYAVLLPADADDQDGSIEQPVHDVVREPDPVVHEGRVIAPALHEERRRFARLERSGHLDVDVLPVVEDANGPPREALAADD